MINFFHEQIDYVFLCYSISFFMLATVCFSVENTHKYKAALKWLGLFGIAQGVHGSLMILSELWHTSFVLQLTLTTVSFVSYIALFECIRMGRDILGQKKTKLSLWLYVAMLLAIVPAAEYGLQGIEVALRYCFGLPVSLTAAVMLYAFAKREQQKSKQRLCKVGSMVMGCYALLIVVNAPPVNIIPVKWLNQVTFLKTVHLPVQFCIAAVIFVLALVILFYFEQEKKRTVFQQLSSSRVLLSSWLIIVMIALLSLGGIFTNYLGEYAYTWLLAHHHLDASDLLYNLSADFTKTDQAVTAISGSPFIYPALLSPAPEELKRAYSVLERYTRSLDMEESLLLDTNGTCISAFHRLDKSKNIGQSFASAPYFRMSMQGSLGYSFVLEPVSGSRSYYAAFPVKSESQTILGAVVMGKKIDGLDLILNDIPYCFFIDAQGKIFLSNQRTFIFTNLWPFKDAFKDTVTLLDEDIFLKQRPLLKREIRDGERITFQGEDYYLIRKQDATKGWSIVLFVSVMPVITYRIFAIMLVLSLCILIMVFFAAVRQRENMVTLIATVNTQLKTVLSAATHVSIIATERQGLITVFNTGAEKMLGYAAEEMVEMHTPEVLHVESELNARAHELDREFGTMLNSFDVLVEYAKRGRYDEREWTYKRADGTLITVNLSITVQRDNKQDIIGFLFVANDITERKWAENKLQEQTEFTENLVQHSGIATFVLDAQHRVIFWNKACEELTGVKAAEMINRTEPWKAFYAHQRPVLADIIIDNKPENAVNFYALCGKSTLAPKGLKAEDWYRNLGGIDRYIIFEAAPIYNSKGELIAAIETLQDITERKRAEETLSLKTKELERSNTELERFAYVASHDLQEPLRMVTSYIQLIEKRYKDKLDRDANDFIGFAVDGVNWMQTLINALLTYSRVGTRASALQATDCNQVLARVLLNLQIAIEEHKAIITHTQLPVIMADTQQMEQLFQNLIGNAIKFHTEEPPRVHISAEQTAHEWIFSICDNGIGIEPQYADRIFEIFQRLHSRREYPGTGIGLAVCKKIVERHGGRIWVESSPGKGATFYFNVPMRR